MFKLIIILCISFFIINSSVLAAIGAVSIATGGSGRGAVEPIDGVLLNPATISDMPDKVFSYNYSSNNWAMTVSDNGRDSFFPAALVFSKVIEPVLDTQKLGLSFATRRWNKIAIGGTVSLMEYTHYLSSSSEQKYRQTNLDLAITYALAKNIGIGLVSNKVNSTKIDLSESLQPKNTTALGISYTYLNFARFRYDIETGAENKTDRLVHMMGVENYISDWIVFRIGYQNNNVVSKNYFTTGLGFAGPQFGLHYAYISNTADKTEDKHYIDLGFPF